MKRKTGLSLVLMLLMVASTFTTVNAIQIQEYTSPSYPPGSIDFTKSVWDSTSETWIDYIEDVPIDTTVRFNISLTYYKNEQSPCEWTLHSIVISDILPECLEFAGNVYFFNAPEIQEEIVDNVVTWNFTASGHSLYDGETMSIEFNANVVQSEENENIATVTASECNHYDHSAQDSAWVYVYVPLPLEFKKEVYNPISGQWVKELDGVKKNVPVDFKITITYNGYEGMLMKCMIVNDDLPECCLEYMPGSDVFTYPNQELFEDPEITVNEATHVITYDWTNKKFNLYEGETITIQLKANVVEYCYGPVDNCAEVYLWSCVGCPSLLYGSDCATVNCFPPETTFNKYVKDTQTGEWTDYTEQYVNQTVTYKIELIYYGNYNLGDVRVVDNLPFITHYEVNSANIAPTDVSEDGLTIWWNLTEPVVDGVPLVITFNAYVWGSTGDCPDCGINYADYTTIESETQVQFSGSDTAKIKTTYQETPPEPLVQLEIKRPKMVFIGKVCANIINTGEKDVPVTWEINVNAGIRKKLYSNSGTIDLLEINMAQQVCTGKSIGSTAIKLKFGRITGTITASAEDYTTGVTFSGLILGRQIIITKWQQMPEGE
ncbi:MAG: isopeptide-forming domain-containing fimbrial protein [Euryarchaeota archaeon]|nr:isopeptide-forming domain-containing fimbrial protein [Euryarchaeota archaeon]